MENEKWNMEIFSCSIAVNVERRAVNTRADYRSMSFPNAKQTWNFLPSVVDLMDDFDSFIHSFVRSFVRSFILRAGENSDETDSCVRRLR